jgi:hypothetical protein
MRISLRTQIGGLAIALGLCMSGSEAVRAFDSGAPSSSVQVAASLRPLVSISAIDLLEFGDLMTTLIDAGVLTGGAGDGFFLQLLSPALVPLPTAGQIEVGGAPGAAVDVACDVESLLAGTSVNFSLEVLLSQNTDGSGFACNGLGAPVLTIGQTGSDAPISVGGEVLVTPTDTPISADQLAEFERQASAIFMAIFQ